MLTTLLFLAAVQAPPDTVLTPLIVGATGAGSGMPIYEKDGVLRSSPEYTDRGPGTTLETRMRLPAAGRVRTSVTDGNDYWKQPVDERFTLENDSATWSSSAERGGRRLGAAASYVGLNAPISSLPLLVRAALAAPGGRLLLLPSGEARAVKVDERTVSSDGRPARITHYQVFGLDFTPMDVWLGDDGRLFAFVAGGWFRVIQPGWESIGDALSAAQDSASNQREARLARSLADHPTGAVAFRHASVFDAPNAALLHNQTVIVRGGRIEAVGADAAVRVPAGAPVIQARGQTLLPRPWGMHSHLSSVHGPPGIPGGVTSSRALADDIDQLRHLRQSWDSGTAIGPRVVMAGFMDGPGPFAGPTKVLVSTPDSALAWVDRYAGLGYEQIKMYSSLDTALVPLIA